MSKMLTDEKNWTERAEEAGIEQNLHKFMGLNAGVDTFKVDGVKYVQVEWLVTAMVGVGYPNKLVNKFSGDGLNKFAEHDLKNHLKTYFSKVDSKVVDGYRVDSVSGGRYRDHYFRAIYKIV